MILEYGNTLEEDIKASCTGDYQKLLLRLCEVRSIFHFQQICLLKQNKKSKVIIEFLFIEAVFKIHSSFKKYAFWGYLSSIDT